MNSIQHISETQTSTAETILSYDGTFSGFLTAIFTIFEHKLKHADIQKCETLQPSIYSVIKEVITDEDKAERVWNGLQKKVGSSFAHDIFASFLSEKQEVDNLLMRVIMYAFQSEVNIAKDYGHADVLRVAQIRKMVGREKHRMEAFVRFRLTKDEIYFSSIEPDFNVLPLIQKHFTSRYADQKWLIYDMKRKYGLFYDLHKSSIIELSETPELNGGKGDIFHCDEKAYEELWKNYFKSTNIASRKNTKLHIRHVPKRYWRYLSEKAPF